MLWQPSERQCVGLGMQVEVRNHSDEVVSNQTGELTCSSPFSCMPVGFWNDADNTGALANPEALKLFRNPPQLND